MFNFLKKTYHRNLLDKMLKKNSGLITGNVLDVGSRNRRYDNLFNGTITACDLISNEELGVERQDLTCLTYKDGYFDSIICIEVLEYLRLENLKTAISEIKRVLKPNGTAVITCPFYYKDHGDNLRLSKTYLNEILSKFGFREYVIHTIGNRHTAYFDAIRYPFLKQTANNKLKKILFSLYYLPRLLFKLIIIKLFGLENKKDDFYSGLFIILKKK